MGEWIFGGYYHTSKLITKGKWYQRLNKRFVKTDWHDFYFVIKFILITMRKKSNINGFYSELKIVEI